MRFGNLLDTLRTLLQNTFDQHARLLQLTFPGPAAKLNDSFVFTRFDDWEAISEGDPRHTINGIPVAYEGRQTSCGAALIATTSNMGKG